MARMLLAAARTGCLAEMLAITSFLSVQDPRERPLERAGSADEKHRIFADERSDFVSVVKLWHWFDEQIKHKKSNRQLANLLAEHFLSPRRMREWRDVHGQLATQTAEMGLRPNEKPAGYDVLHQALLTGLLGNIGFRSDDVKARKPGEGMYQGARPALFPASGLDTGEEGAEMGGGCRAHRYRPPDGPHGGGSAAGMDRGRRPACRREELFRAALGQKVRARHGL